MAQDSFRLYLCPEARDCHHSLWEAGSTVHEFVEVEVPLRNADVFFGRELEIGQIWTRPRPFSRVHLVEIS